MTKAVGIYLSTTSPPTKCVRISSYTECPHNGNLIDTMQPAWTASRCFAWEGDR